MAQKLIYINKKLNDENNSGALDWLTSSSDNTDYRNPSNIYYHSLVFTKDNYLITHGVVYNGHDTIISPSDLQDLGVLLSTGKVNNADVSVYTQDGLALPTIFAPTTGGTKGLFLVSNGSTNAPVWTNLKDILKKTTYNITTNDPSTTNCVLKYTTSGLTWSPDDDTKYNLTLNGSVVGTSGGTSLGSFYAPTAAGTLYQVLLSAGENNAPTWSTVTSNLSGVASEDHTLPSSYAVKSYITDQIAAAVTQAMVYKGTVLSHTALPTGSNVSNGDVYMFTGSGTYGSGNNAKDYKAGDTAIAKVNGSTVTWEIVPSGNEQETFITVISSEDLTSATYNKATGEVKLGTAALKNYLVSTGTSDIASNTTSSNLVSAKLVKDYVTSRGYTNNTGTVTNIAAGTGLTTASGSAITTTGTIKANLNSESSLGTLGTTSKLYAVGVDSGDKLSVSVPWTDTTYSFAVGGSSATTNATSTVNDTVYIRYLPSGGSWANLVQIAEGSGIDVSAINGKITITNKAMNVTTSMLVGKSNSTSNAAVTTNGDLYLRLNEGGTYSNFNIIGTGAAKVTSTGSGNITIDALNTWRPVYAYKLTTVGGSSTTGLEILATGTGTDSLAFGSEFVYAEGDTDINASTVSEIHLAWAEVDAAGAVTYVI